MKIKVEDGHKIMNILGGGRWGTDPRGTIGLLQDLLCCSVVKRQVKSLYG